MPEGVPCEVAVGELPLSVPLTFPLQEGDFFSCQSEKTMCLQNYRTHVGKVQHGFPDLPDAVRYLLSSVAV